jgi:hypothetical protein
MGDCGNAKGLAGVSGWGTPKHVLARLGLVIVAACNGGTPAEADNVSAAAGQASFQQIAAGTTPSRANGQAIRQGGVQPVRSTVYTVFDKGGPVGAGPALDVVPPTGWRVESAVRWDNVNGNCSMAIGSPMFRMTSPDGRSSIEMLPGFLVTTSEQEIRRRGSVPGDFCILAMATNGEQLAGQVAVPFLRPQARITGMRQVALAPSIASMVPRIEQMRASGVNMIPYTVETMVSNPDNTVEKITLGGVVQVFPQMMQGVLPLVVNQNFVGYTVRAPEAQFAATEMLAAKVRASIKYRPAWQQAVAAYQNRLTKPVFAQPGSRPSGQNGWNGGGSGGGTGGYNGGNTGSTGSQTNDIIHRRNVDSIREEQRCQLADGTVVVVSIHTGCPSQ